MKKLIILCDGGLGNRLNSLIGGILVAKHLNRIPVICWPENTWCGCTLGDLMESTYEVVNIDINTLFTKHKDDIFLICENQTSLDIQFSHPENFNAIDELKNSNSETIIYYHNAIPIQHQIEQVLNILSEFTVLQTISNIVKGFCLNTNIDNSVIGIHLRGTDSGFNLHEDQLYNEINNNVNVRYFICTDDKQVETKFIHLPNVIIFPKQYYVEKLIDGTWGDWITDNEGRKFPFNVNRTKESVIEGFIDMLILSNTNIRLNSGSSFLKHALLFKELKNKNI